MTIPSERYRALRQLPELLRQFSMQPGPISKHDLRQLVSRLLRHYPFPSELDELARRCPRLLDKDE